MNARTAKRLRRIAQEQGRFYQGNHKYYEVSVGQARPATFGRRVISLMEKFKHTVTTYVPKKELTIQLRPDSVRGIYKELKRGLRMARLNDRSGAALIAPRRLRRRKTQTA